MVKTVKIASLDDLNSLNKRDYLDKIEESDNTLMTFVRIWIHREHWKKFKGIANVEDTTAQALGGWVVCSYLKNPELFDALGEMNETQLKEIFEYVQKSRKSNVSNSDS